MPPDGQDLTLNHLDQTMLWQALAMRLLPAPRTWPSATWWSGFEPICAPFRKRFGGSPMQGLKVQRLAAGPAGPAPSPGGVHDGLDRPMPSDLLCQGRSRKWADPCRACPVCAPLRKVRRGIGVKQGPMD